MLLCHQEDLRVFLDKKKVGLEEALKDQTILLRCALLMSSSSCGDFWAHFIYSACSKYRFMEENHVAQKRNYLSKVADLEVAIDSLQGLIKKRVS